jgi:hypothetical protein
MNVAILIFRREKAGGRYAVGFSLRLPAGAPVLPHFRGSLPRYG